MTGVSDRDREILTCLRDLAGDSVDIDEAFARAAGWLGAEADRRASLFEVITYILAKRGQDGPPADMPEHAVTDGKFIRWLAGDVYGVLGKVREGDLTKWPLSALRSPLDLAHGGAERIQIAVGLGAWHRYHVLPSHWPWVVHAVRLISGLLLCALLYPLSPPQLRGSLAALVLGYVLCSMPSIHRRLAMPIGVAQFNLALVSAMNEFSASMEAVKDAEFSRANPFSKHGVRSNAR